MPYTVDASRVVYERVDDEVTLIDLETGNYYSILAAGVELWDAVRQGGTLDAAASHLIEHYAVDHEVATAATRRFVDELIATGLLATGDGGSDAPVLVPPANGRRPWQEPVLESYTDMQDFLLLDPIHEVDPGGGWPRAADE